MFRRPPARRPETGVEVAEAPRFRRLSHRQLPLGGRGEVLLGPLQRGDLHPVGRCPFQVAPGGPVASRRPDVAVGEGVGTVRPQGFEGIGHEGEQLEVQLDTFDRFGGRRFVDCRHSQNRLTLEHRLVRQRRLRARPFGEVVGGENRFDPRHRERRAGIDAPDARVRHRAEEQLAEQHAIGAEVLRVLGSARHFRDQIRRRVVAADELLLSHVALPYVFRAPSIAVTVSLLAPAQAFIACARGVQVVDGPPVAASRQGRQPKQAN